MCGSISGWPIRSSSSFSSFDEECSNQGRSVKLLLMKFFHNWHLHCKIVAAQIAILGQLLVCLNTKPTSDCVTEGNLTWFCPPPILSLVLLAIWLSWWGVRIQGKAYQIWRQNVSFELVWLSPPNEGMELLRKELPLRETLLQPLDIFEIQTIIFFQAITLFISRELKNCSEEGKTMMSCDAFKAYEYIFKL